MASTFNIFLLGMESHFEFGRTNYAGEGFHSKLNRCINRSVVGLYKVVRGYKKIKLYCDTESLRLLTEYG